MRSDFYDLICSMYHHRKTRLSYKKYNHEDTKKPICTLCADDNKSRIINENDSMFVLPNRVSYDIFEGMRVLEHLMIVPKNHRESLAEFTERERIDFMTLASYYESQGYTILARGKGSHMRSVNHQHTHLLKLDNQKARVYFYLRKPYFMIKL